MTDDKRGTSKRCRTWIRRVAFFAVLLVLGALANASIVIVLSCTISPDLQSQPRWKIYYNAEGPELYVFVLGRFGVDSAISTSRAPHMDRPFDGDLDDLPDWIEPERIAGITYQVARGWPVRATYHYAATARTPGATEAGGWATPLPEWSSLSGWTFPRVIPYLPIWRGIIINTLFYAAALWVMWMMYSTMRSARRRRKGLCVACKYDLRGADHARCPECGITIKCATAL